MILVSGRGVVLDSQGPVLILEPRSSIEFSNETGTMIHCSAQGSPLPRIDWLMGDGSAVNPIQHIRKTLVNGSMYFLPFGAESYRHDVHSAVYRCQASNSVGRVLSREITVKAGEYLYFSSSNRSPLIRPSSANPDSWRNYPTLTRPSRNTLIRNRTSISNGSLFSTSKSSQNLYFSRYLTNATDPQGTRKTVRIKCIFRDFGVQRGRNPTKNCRGTYWEYRYSQLRHWKRRDCYAISRLRFSESEFTVALSALPALRMQIFSACLRSPISPARKNRTRCNAAGSQVLSDRAQSLRRCDISSARKRNRPFHEMMF